MPTADFTLVNLAHLFTPSILSSYWISIKVSAASSIGGAIAGFFLAYAVVMGRLPRWLRPTLMTFSGVASNFAGLPLAFAFIATLGPTGLITKLLRDTLDFNLYGTGFKLLGFWGLTLTYLYFQIPLMILILAPALDGLKREWREASEILGATHWQYWRHVALPVLWPSILGTTCFSSPTLSARSPPPTRLTGSSLNIVTIQLYAQIRGDVLHDPNLGYALALGMIVITGLSSGGYIWLAGAEREVAAMRGSRLGSWIALILGTLYFVVPLIATFEFSLRMRRGVYSFDAYQVVFSDPRFFPQSIDITKFHDATFLYSTVAALATIVLGVLLVVPTAYWIQLRLPRPARHRRVHHPPAAGRPGHRHRLRLPPPLQFFLDPAADRFASGRQTCFWSLATSRWRCLTCTGRSTPGCARSTCAPSPKRRRVSAPVGPRSSSR